MVTGRYSTVLVEQFDAHVSDRTANVFQIFDEIGKLEGAPNARGSRTKPATRFTRAPLKGLWHKHYTQATFLATNILLHWTPARLNQLLKEVVGGGAHLDERGIRRLSHEVVMRGYEDRRRAGRMTGEWIVFARTANVSYYLTLASHTEDDAEIWRRCQACAVDFPELQFLSEDR